MKMTNMKLKYILWCGIAMLLAACQPDNYRKVYPAGNPVVEARLLTPEVQFGQDTIAFAVTVSETQTPLSTLRVKVMVGVNRIASEELRTRDFHYADTLRYAVPFGANMPEGEQVKVYLTATNVEGTSTDYILSGCVGHRPAIETLYIMPPTIDYTVLGKGKQMTQEDDRFVAYGLGYPKSMQCLLAVVGTKFGRVDWTHPVFGMLDGKLSLITQAQFESGEATPITIEDDQVESIDTIAFNPLTFALTYSGKVAQPVTSLDVMNDLAEEPASITSTSVRKLYRGAKVYFAKDSEFTLTGVQNVETACNYDYMEWLGGDKVKWLGETGMYNTYYHLAGDYIVIEPLADVVYPDAMWLCGVGMGQPTANPELTSGWGFDSPNQNFAARTVAPKIYQFTVYMKNAPDAEHPGFGTVNFKFFHQHGWGGEEASTNYTISGLNIIASTEESNVGNWWSSDEEFEGIYRITLNMNNMTNTYEKIK
ncbi:MAG: DUF5121 domain-containing protein [Paludibacteraceae bacterium]|nr:DUF5121 domain-containing protein [Paludibacteraceae bacterium]